jgi:hypothetical protein
VTLVVGVLGLWLTRRSRTARVFHAWLAATLAFIVIAGYGNRHPWYQMPLVPIVAGFGGYAMNWLAGKLAARPWAKIAVFAFIVVAMAIQSFAATKRLYRPAAADLKALGLALRENTSTRALIVVADYGDPTALYYGERKGWHFTEKDSIYNGHPITSADAIADLEHLRGQGATHIAFYSGSLWWLNFYGEFAEHLARTSKLVGATPAYQIFELRGATVEQ